MQRPAGDLGDGIPHRHVERADGDRALAMAARLLVAHHRVPDGSGIEIVVRAVDQAGRVGGAQPRQEALAQQRALRIAAVRVEAESHHRAPVAHHVGDQRHHRAGHLREIDDGVGDRRRDGDGLLADVDDAHANPCRLAGGEYGKRRVRRHCRIA